MGSGARGGCVCPRPYGRSLAPIGDGRRRNRCRGYRVTLRCSDADRRRRSWSTGTPLSVAPAAAAQLKRVAQAAAGQAMPAAGQWEYLAIKQENTATLSNNSGSVTVVYTDTQTEQNWIAANGDTRSGIATTAFRSLRRRTRATYLADKAVLHVGSRFPGYDPTVPGVIEDRMFPTWSIRRRSGRPRRRVTRTR